MNDVLSYAVLGIGIGAIYTLLAQGIVVVYRASGLLNFAHGSVAMVGAYTFYELNQVREWPYLTAMAIAVAVSALLGLTFFWLVLKRLRYAAPMARVIATLGLLAALQAGATIRYKDTILVIPSAIPQRQLTLGPVNLASDRLVLLGIAVVITVVLTLLSTKTRFGLATSGVAENERSVAAFGWSPDRVAAVNWAAGAGLAGLAGVLIAPLAGLRPSNLTLLIIPVLAVALVASFRSFPLLLLGGVLIGCLQTVAGNFLHVTGLPQSIGFFVIVFFLVLRGRALPLRSHVAERLPALGTGIVRLRVVLPVAAVVGVVVLVTPVLWTDAFTMSFAVAVMLLSIVVLTGYAGQLSLAQYALGGVGAIVAGRLVAEQGLPFELAIVAGVLGSTVMGLIFALPALRVRGVNLAIVTLGLGYALETMVFQEAKYVGGYGGSAVGPQTFFGISVDAITSPAAYAILCLIALVLATIVVANLRRSPTGRRLIAVRTNERAAAALGVNVMGAKVYAFAVSAALAGLAGILITFRNYSIVVTEFSPLASINMVTLAVVGGVGYAIGPLFGATLAPGGVPGGILGHTWQDASQWLVLIGGLVIIALLTHDSNGVVSGNVRAANALLAAIRRRGRDRTPTPVPSPDKPAERVRPLRLEVRDITVRFGGVTAVDTVSLHVEPGEIVGLIGPNGAGKTTVVDAITGFVRPTSGDVRLGDRSLDRQPSHARTRAGITRSFQSLELFDDVSVEENLRVSSDEAHGWGYVTDLVFPRRVDLSSSAVTAIQEFRLTELLAKKPSELPYAQRRLVAVARAAAAKPSILLLDEPAAGLNEAAIHELSELVRRLARAWGMGILLIEHDMSMVMNVCDRVVVLEFGKKIADATPAEILTDARVQGAYLGTVDSAIRAGS